MQGPDIEASQLNKLESRSGPVSCVSKGKQFLPITILSPKDAVVCGRCGKKLC